MILLLGTIAALVYFFFSKKHEGAIGKIGKVGIYFLMVSFGASFGFTVIGRISLLIGRFEDLIKFKNCDRKRIASASLESGIRNIFLTQ